MQSRAKAGRKGIYFCLPGIEKKYICIHSQRRIEVVLGIPNKSGKEAETDSPKDLS